MKKCGGGRGHQRCAKQEKKKYKQLCNSSPTQCIDARATAPSQGVLQQTAIMILSFATVVIPTIVADIATVANMWHECPPNMQSKSNLNTEQTQCDTLLATQSTASGLPGPWVGIRATDGKSFACVVARRSIELKIQPTLP